MTKLMGTLLATSLAGLMACGSAGAQAPFMFGVLGNTFSDTEHESLLIRSITEVDSANLTFVLVNGIKSPSESCSDGLYQQRRDLLDLSETAIVVSLTAADWIGCHNKHGASISTERLTHIRDLFFTDAQSLGQHTLPVVRQSVLPQYRRYAENARWESHGILFSTLNIPVPNNHWIKDGGRNNEFEDRVIANKDWLNRLFLLANVQKSPGIVIFSDANFMAPHATSPSLLQGERDGFAEVRQHLATLAAGFKGKVLLVHSQVDDTMSATINWAGNLGQVAIHGPWMAIEVSPGNASVFTIKNRKDIPGLVPAPTPASEEIALAR